jgi:hypothetical protein
VLAHSRAAQRLRRRARVVYGRRMSGELLLAIEGALVVVFWATLIVWLVRRFVLRRR